ncbi:dihydrofolate reductase family protein [Catelliglobosispora koreensis]|uniref:dihydrofolate reductase family protein n=1 Tax=Catelliglobosispora koreensis TaxID=129052 RepID=UPI000373713F|nr:dihydrofolate reductase family protein [Catelliglobosispora koreensis]
MGKVFVHATVTLDGFMADSQGGMDWMFGFDIVDKDMEAVKKVIDEIGAIVGGANETRTIEEGELPYGGSLKVPVYLMTHEAHEPVEKDGVTYSFVVDDIAAAVEAAKADAGDKSVSLLGGSISRQCLKLGLVDEIHLHVVPVLLGQGIALFGGLDTRITLERLHTAAYASETHMHYRVVR